MPHPFQITHKILNLVAELSRLVGSLEGIEQGKSDPLLRKQNQIRTVHSSLAIEGNTLTLDQVSTLFNDKKVIGPPKEIKEVRNAIELYRISEKFKVHSMADFKKAHKILMNGLIESAGGFRSGNVGIIKGGAIQHVAPKPIHVPRLMEELFDFIKSEKEISLAIRSAVFHYECEFIHPFDDGNGRMGRFWQHLMLTHFHPIFNMIPFESVIHANQQTYYDTLAQCDKAGDSTKFIEFRLMVISESLSDFYASFRQKPLLPKDRIEIAREKLGDQWFSRREYQVIFKTISTATASRDLQLGTEQRLLKKKGDKSLARYRFV